MDEASIGTTPSCGCAERVDPWMRGEMRRTFSKESGTEVYYCLVIVGYMTSVCGGPD